MTEYDLHKSIIQYIELLYPWAMFYSDLNGIKTTKGQGKKIKAIQMKNYKWLDLTIFEPMTIKGVVYHGLIIELKRNIYDKDGGGYRLVNGKLPKDNHLEAQQKTIEALRERGYWACFCGGFEEAKLTIDAYFDGTLFDGGILE